MYGNAAQDGRPSNDFIVKCLDSKSQSNALHKPATKRYTRPRIKYHWKGFLISKLMLMLELQNNINNRTVCINAWIIYARLAATDAIPSATTYNNFQFVSILCPSDYCKGRETLHNLCEQIAGDALLYSLFKENAEPVKCPLRGMSLRLWERWSRNESMHNEYKPFWFQVLIRLHIIEATASVSILCRISKAALRIAGSYWVFKHVRMSREPKAQVQHKHLSNIIFYYFFLFITIGNV